jgi:hypothetical protein
MVPQSFTALIELWETAEALALDVGEPAQNVRAWKYRRFIPAEHWVRIVGAARRRGYQVTYEHLARLAAEVAEQRRQQKVA